MRSMSDDEWFEQLDEVAKDRVQRIVDARSKQRGGRLLALEAARTDAGGKHAQLAFEHFCTFLSADNFLPAGGNRKMMLECLLEGEPWEQDADQAPRALARVGVEKALAGGASHDELLAFAWTVARRYSERIGEIVFDYASTTGPGWRLMETWLNDETGRPLSRAVICEAFDRAGRAKAAKGSRVAGA